MRRLALLLASTAAVSAVLLGAVATANAAPAVVFMSGLNSATSFTNATPACAGKEGATWDSPSGPPAALRAAGREVYTVPAGEDAKPPAPCGSPTPAADMVVDSGGDADANGAALLRFLSFLKAQYAVEQVQLVAHSDGGIWSRAAITQAASADVPSILSLTTLGTPHTGAWSADLAIGGASVDCSSTICKILRTLAQTAIGDLGETAVQELTSTYTADWNEAQAIAACPVTTIAGTYLRFGDILPAYYLPTDGLVGRASAHAAASTSIGGKTIPAAGIPNVSDAGDFPVVHSPALKFLGTDLSLVNDPAISAAVSAIVNASPTGPPCPPGAAVGARGASSVAADLIRPIELGRGDGLRATDRDVLLHARRTTVRCDGDPVRRAGGVGRRLRVSVVGDCGRVSATGPALVIRHRGRVKVRRVGRKLRVRSKALGSPRVELRRSRGWRELDRDRGRYLLPRRAGDAITLRVRERGGRRLATLTLDG